MNKKIIAIVIAVAAMVNASSAFADFSVNNDSQFLQEAFEQKLTNIFTNPSLVELIVISKDGEDISENFRAAYNHKLLLRSQNTILSEFYYDNVRSIRAVMETRTNGAVTRVEQIQEALTGVFCLTAPNGAVTPWSATINVDYTVTGTIHYDVNTFKITSTVGPNRSAIRFSGTIDDGAYFYDTIVYAYDFAGGDMTNVFCLPHERQLI